MIIFTIHIRINILGCLMAKTDVAGWENSFNFDYVQLSAEAMSW